MKKITMSLFAVASMLTAEGKTVTNISDALTMGAVSGELRGFYIDRTYTGGIENNRNSLAIGGHVGYNSAPLHGLSFGVRFYATYGLPIHEDAANDMVTPADSYDPSLYGDGFDSYLFLGEAYLNYVYGNTTIKLGRQRLDTPMAGSDDARMLPNLFEAVVVTNTDIKDTTLILAHVTKETVGTFGNVYSAGTITGGVIDASGILSLHSGYGLGYKLGTNGEFATMGEIALGKGTDTDGVTAVAAIYKGVPGLTLQAWDYYAHDILNALYLQADYGWNCLVSDAVKMNASLQYINESDVGDALAGAVDSTYWAAQLAATYGDFTATVAYSQTDDAADAQNYGIITPWGGMAAFTQGMVTRHQFLPDTTATKVAATYNFTQYNLKATAYYASFDVGNAGYAANMETAEAGFDLIYQATSDLQVRLRGNFPTDFGVKAAVPFDWSEYRLIVNYKF